MLCFKSLNYRELQNYKKSLTLTPIQREILIGTLLGDASMGLVRSKPVYSIKFEQSIKNQEYIVHLYDNFKEFTLKPYYIRLIKRNNLNHQDIMSIWFKTFVHPSFKFYYDIFYDFDIEKRKCVKKVPQIIHKLLTARSLAYWYMDDGNLEKNGCSLSTNRFSYKDNKLLQKILKEKFLLNVIIRKDKIYYRMVINSIDFLIFKKLVQPFILPCFFYKLGI